MTRSAADTPHEKIGLLMQLRGQGVDDMRVLNAIESTPRELFVPPGLSRHAWENTALPIGCGQTISQPIVVALMTQKLEVGERMRVLEIGTGSGYQTAILSRLARRVYTVERHETLLREARRRFGALRLGNVVSMLADGTRGWPVQAPFDRIMVTAAAESMPASLLDQLSPGGIMVVPVGSSVWDQKLLCVRRTDESYDCEAFLDVRFVPLVEGRV